MQLEQLDFLKKPMAVARFQARVRVQREHQKTSFEAMRSAGERFDVARAAIQAWPEEKMFEVGRDASMRGALAEKDALKTLYEDLGATILLLAAATFERFEKELDSGPLRDKGSASYVPTITFVQAIISLVNQYKHFGEWQNKKPANEKNYINVKALVDNHLRSDAAAEFLKRCGFSKYEKFESKLLSCCEGIANPLTVPDGGDGLPKVTVRLPPPHHGTKAPEN